MSETSDKPENSNDKEEDKIRKDFITSLDEFVASTPIATYTDTAASIKDKVEAALLKGDSKVKNYESLIADEVNKAPWEIEQVGDTKVMFVPKHFDSDNIVCLMLLRMAKDRGYTFGVAGSSDEQTAWTTTSLNKEDQNWCLSSMCMWGDKPLEKFSTANLDSKSLFRQLVWQIATKRAIKTPKTKGSPAWDFVLPSYINKLTIEDAFKKAIQRVIATMPAGSEKAASTYKTFLYEWMDRDDVQDHCLYLVREQPIKWKHIIEAAPHKQNKVKDKKTKQIVVTWAIATPMQPNATAWLMPEEKENWPQGAFPEWREPEALRLEWLSLTAPEQHDKKKEFRGKIKACYAQMELVQQEVSKSVGGRKKFVEAALKALNLTSKLSELAPRDKMQKFCNRVDLSKLPEGAKRSFNPANYLGNRGRARQIYSAWVANPESSEGEKIKEAKDLAPDTNEDDEFQVTSAPIMINWLTRFKIDFTKELSQEDINPNDIILSNRFAPLAVNKEGKSELLIPAADAIASAAQRKLDLDKKHRDQKLTKTTKETASNLGQLNTYTTTTESGNKTLLALASKNKEAREKQLGLIHQLNKEMRGQTEISQFKNGEPILMSTCLKKDLKHSPGASHLRSFFSVKDSKSKTGYVIFFINRGNPEVAYNPWDVSQDISGR